MSRKRIAVSDNSETLVLPKELLTELGVVDGDEIEVAVVNNSVVLRRVDELERGKRLATPVEMLFERRREAYKKLAEGTKLHIRLSLPRKHR